MDSSKPDIDELISGMLDGRLTISESKQLEEELSTNPDKARALETLASLRRSLLSGRPTGKLGDGFAGKIAAAARARAEQMGAEAPEWLVPKSRNKTKSENDYSKRWWIPVTTVGSVAVVGCLMIAILRWDREQFQPKSQAVVDIESLQKGELENRVAASGSESDFREDNSDALVLQKSVDPRTDNSDIKSSSLAQAEQNNFETKEIEPYTREPQSLVAEELGSSLAKETNPTNAGSNDLPFEHLALNNFTSRATAIYEVSVDKIARENRTLEVYLEKNGFGQPLDMELGSPEMKEVFHSGIAGALSQEGNVQVLALKGAAKSLAQFYSDLSNSYEDFPHLFMNIALTDATSTISQQLEDVEVSDSVGAARRLAGKSDGVLVSRFQSGKLRGIELNRQAREKLKLQVPGGAHNPIEVVLLVVRYVD